MHRLFRTTLNLLFLGIALLCNPLTFADAKSEAMNKAQTAKEKLVKPKASQPKNYPPYPNVHFKTNIGDLYFMLDSIRAPLTVKNFLQYVETGHYDNTIFHRVIPGFVAQGGGYIEDYTEKETREPVVNESGNGLSNVTGTLAMARTNDPHSATSQFYVNLVDNQKLDPRPDRWGYTVFGEVQYGMKMLTKVSKMPRGAGGQFSKDVPIEPLIVEKARVMASGEEVPLEPIVFDDEDVDEDEVEDVVEETTEEE